MSLTSTLKRRWKWLLLIVPLAVAAVGFGGSFVYIHFISPDPAPKLTFSSADPAGSPASGAGDASATAAGTIDGTWNVTTGSTVQYRVHETLFGQENEATGTGTAVTGQLTLAGTTVKTASFSVEVAKITSDEAQRDGQFRNRIMNTSQFPTATFELTKPIELGSIPANKVEIPVAATGKLTMHGTTREITFELKALRSGSQLQALGTIPITFSDYGIKDPSGGPAQVGDNGDLEFLLIFSR